ncbi:MAG: caspase family protein [Myxococcota bacterium]
MRVLAPLVIVALAAAGCAHGSGEKGDKGGLVTVKASPDEVQKAFSGRRFALLLGIPHSGRDEHWQPLRYALKDVADLSAVLQDPLRGRFSHVEQLTTPEQTTREAVKAALARLSALATQPEDVLVVYVSAHGTLARDARGELERYLVTSDAEFHRVSQTALPIDALSRGLEGSRSRRRVVVLATCHSGSGKSLLPEDVATELASRKGGLRPLEEVSRASIVLSASDFLETAREDEALENDVYTHWLIEALAGGGDRNGDGAVTATEAHDYARRRTWAFSNGRQRPAAELNEVGADPVVLTGDFKRTGQPELYSYVPRLDGFTLRVDGLERAELPGGAAVGAGAHRVELTKGDEVFVSEDVTLEAGQRIDLDTLARKKEPFFALSATGGAFGFVDRASQQQLLPLAPAVGLAARFERVLLNRLSVEADLSGFGGQGTLTLVPGAPGVPFGWSAILAGVSVAWQWDTRWVSFWVGPRVAGLWVQRSFSRDTWQGTQSAFSMTPGLLVGGAFHLTERVELSVGLQGSVVVVMVDGASQTLGFAGAWAGLGYRF